jgi:uncharacterized RmlC-like cupin family protein
MKGGDFFYVPPGHDSWVVGDEPWVASQARCKWTDAGSHAWTG